MVEFIIFSDKGCEQADRILKSFVVTLDITTWRWYTSVVSINITTNGGIRNV